jgi:alkanesulfonate monooxygenase SsuD/methylene tetrahydromethanopterin reductase-like flavin-dependent oxidoreductase (luciferase family)
LVGREFVKHALGVGIGWNEVEFVGLNEDFHNRGRRSEEQVQVMQALQALWAEPHVGFNGQWHHINDAGINPLPTRRRVPIWFGGHHGRSGASRNGVTDG